MKQMTVSRNSSKLIYKITVLEISENCQYFTSIVYQVILEDLQNSFLKKIVPYHSR